MRSRLTLLFGAVLVLAGVALGSRSASRTAGATSDPLAAEIERWSRYVREHKSSDEDWANIRKVTEPALADAQAALSSGRRFFALQRLGAARVLLSATAYVSERTDAERKDEAAFERERTRMGERIRADLAMPSPSAFDGVRPAAVRAAGETSLPQVKILYDTSLDYARNTLPDAGLFYIGEANAQREFAQLCRRLEEPAAGTPPPVRSLGPELEALESRLLAAYRPPASIDRHTDFIRASSQLKEARELDSAGLRYGALLRYLQTVQSVAALAPSESSVAPGSVGAKLDALERSLSEGGVDHTIGRTFLESARADMDSKTPGETLERAPAIASEVLPAYLAALAPAPPSKPRPAARVTVTLVRWPYT